MVARPESRFVFGNGINIHYLDWGGGGHPLVCIHGATSECHRWDKLAQLLFPDFRVLSPDLRGHGDTDKPGVGYALTDFAADLNALADAVGLERFSLLGHSMGVPIIVAYAALHPERVRALIPVDMPFETGPEFRGRLIELLGKGVSSFSSLEEAKAGLATTFDKTGEMSEEGMQEKLGRLRQNALGRWEWKCHLSAVMEALRLIPDSLRQYAQRIECPTLVMRGALSTLVSHEEALGAVKSLRHGQLAEIEKAPHDLMWYNLEGMVAALRDFLKGK